jgi:pimeloyl-ACP methyl ester carboxylesterase
MRGAADHVVPPDYGWAFADAIAKAKFELVEKAGHMPWLEQPAETLPAVDVFIAGVSVHR